MYWNVLNNVLKITTIIFTISILIHYELKDFGTRVTLSNLTLQIRQIIYLNSYFDSHKHWRLTDPKAKKGVGQGRELSFPEKLHQKNWTRN